VIDKKPKTDNVETVLASIDSDAIRDSYATHQFQIAVRMRVSWHLTSNALRLPSPFHRRLGRK
jgi:hypothetical protein